MTAWVASLVSLAIVIAVAVYGMPIGQTLLAGSEGAAFGFFPILWIVINAIWVFQMTVATGHFDVLRRSFTRVSDDQRIQAIIIVVFVICQIPVVKSLLDKATFTVKWPGLHLLNAKGEELSLATFTFNLLTTPGTQMLIAGILTMIALRLSVPRALRAYGVALHQLRWAIVTVMTVPALAFVMNASGQTITLGTWMAGAGAAFALLSPILGWLGVAVTGSDTSSNSLFGALQVTAAGQAGLSEVLMAAGNSSGGVLGKMISPQNLVIAAAAVGLNGREGDIFRRVIGWSLIFLACLCVLSALQASILSWMVP